jgi:hypothetical protein
MALPPAISNYVREFVEALHAEQSEAVAALLSFAAMLPSGHEFALAHKKHAPIHTAYKSDNSRGALISTLSSCTQSQRARLAESIEPHCGDTREWAPIMAAHLNSLFLLASAESHDEFDATFSATLIALKEFVSLFEHQETNWLVTALHVLAHDSVHLLSVMEKRLAKEWMQDRVGKQLVRYN